MGFEFRPSSGKNPLSLIISLDKKASYLLPSCFFHWVCRIVDGSLSVYLRLTSNFEVHIFYLNILHQFPTERDFDMISCNVDDRIQLTEFLVSDYLSEWSKDEGFNTSTCSNCYSFHKAFDILTFFYPYTMQQMPIYLPDILNWEIIERTVWYLQCCLKSGWHQFFKHVKH